MNILIINGSPRKKGLISQMLGIMREEAEKRGDTVEMVYTNDLTVKPCSGCMACRTHLMWLPFPLLELLVSILQIPHW